MRTGENAWIGISKNGVWAWMAPVYEGFFLEQRRLATLVNLHLSESYGNAGDKPTKQVMRVNEAQHALWQALEEGLVQATGISAQTGTRIPIAAHEWPDLRYFEVRQKDAVRPGPLASAGYEAVALPRKGVTALWAEKLDKPVIGLPEIVEPSGPGYIPLYCAAHWIATAGGSEASTRQTFPYGKARTRIFWRASLLKTSR